MIGCQLSMHMEQISCSGPGEKGGPEGKGIRIKEEKGVLVLDWEVWVWKA